MVLHRRLLLLILVAAIALTPLKANGTQTYSVTATEVTIYRDGLVQVKQVMNVNETMVSISLPLLSTSIGNVLVVDQGDIPLSYEVVLPNITIVTLGATKTTLEYITSTLTKKEGSVWTLKMKTPYNTTMTLPDQASIVYLNEMPSSIASKGNQTTLTLPPGQWEVSYVFPVAPVTPKPPPPPPPATTPFPIEYLALISGVAAVSVAGVFLMRRRGARVEEAEELRSEDKEVLKFIAEKGGKILESELRQKFLLPRTSAWRLVRRLERMGYVRVHKVGVQNEIELIRRT